MVKLIRTDGSDRDIAVYSRISFGRTYIADSDVDRQLNQLLKNKHEKPFEFASMLFFIRCSRACHSQLATHRMASMLSMSHRYCRPLELADTGLYKDLPEDRKNHMHYSLGKYVQMVEKGIPKEQARGVLPMDCLIECYWQANIRSLFNFFTLRLDSHAQSEIRDLANEIYVLFEQAFPITAKYYKTYYLEAKCNQSTIHSGSEMLCS